MIRSKRTNFQILTKLFKGIAFSVAAIGISFFRKPASGWQPAWHIPTKPFCDGEQGRQDSNGPIPGRPVRAAVWESGGKEACEGHQLIDGSNLGKEAVAKESHLGKWIEISLKNSEMWIWDDAGHLHVPPIETHLICKVWSIGRCWAPAF